MPKRGPKIRLGSYFDLNGGGLSLGQGVGGTTPSPSLITADSAVVTADSLKTADGMI